MFTVLEYDLFIDYHQAMNPFRTGKLVLFQVTYDRDWHFFEIIFFVILGIFGVSTPPQLVRLKLSLLLLSRVCMEPLLSSSISRPQHSAASIWQIMPLPKR